MSISLFLNRYELFEWLIEALEILYIFFYEKCLGGNVLRKNEKSLSLSDY